MPAYKDKNGKWFAKFQYRENGKAKTKLKRGFAKKRDALDYERKFIESYAPSFDMTFETCFNVFMKSKERELRPNTLKIYRVAKQYYAPICDMKLSEITPHDILTVRESMNTGTATANLYMSKLSRIFNFAMTMYGLKKNPCRGIGVLKEEPKEIRFLTMEQVKELRSLPMKADTLMLLDLLFWTGMRISEALAITAEDVHDTYIDLFKHKTGDGTVYKGLKNNQGRKVSIHESLSKELKEYIANLYGRESELFPLRYYTYQKRFKQMFRQIGLEDATLHSFRHSHVAMLMHLGYSPKIIADRIGDTVDTMLKVYAHVYESDIHEMMIQLENVSVSYQ